MEESSQFNGCRPLQNVTISYGIGHRLVAELQFDVSLERFPYEIDFCVPQRERLATEADLGIHTRRGRNGRKRSLQHYE